MTLQWGHGDDAVEDSWLFASATRRRSRFNGATAMMPWKTPKVNKLPAEPEWLQWGHGDDAVEDKAGNKYSDADVDASMGPRR